MFFANQTIELLTSEFGKIPSKRKDILKSLAAAARQAPNLVFICTHNSRRSHIAHVWAKTAAVYYNVSSVRSYSGGTEATAFDQRAIDALRRIGFIIEATSKGYFTVAYSDEHAPFDVFSKRYDATVNPASDFVAVMVCSDADQNCPIVNGASSRISLPFDDPKDFDGTPEESAKYYERSIEIGREILYAFSLIMKP